MPTFASAIEKTKVDAKIAQLVEHNLLGWGREFESRFPLNVSRKKN